MKIYTPYKTQKGYFVGGIVDKSKVIIKKYDKKEEALKCLLKIEKCKYFESEETKLHIFD